jgi:hypothetical protein
MTKTRPASAVENKSGCFFSGTLGFDLYLAVLGLSPAALRPSRVPSFGGAQ